MLKKMVALNDLFDISLYYKETFKALWSRIRRKSSIMTSSILYVASLKTIQLFLGAKPNVNTFVDNIGKKNVGT